MALQNEDLLVIQRDDTHYSIKADDLLTYTGVEGCLRLSGGTMTGNLTLNRPGVGDGFTIKGKNASGDVINILQVYHNNQPGTAEPDAINYLGRQDGDVNLVTNGWVTSNFVGLNSTQTLNTNKWIVQQKDSGNTTRNFIEIHNNNMKLFHVQDPTDGNDAWAANKGYVDTKTAGLATEDYVDTEVANYLPLTGGDMSGRIDITMPDPGNAAIRTIGSINVKANGQQIGGSNNFIAGKDYVRVWSTPSGPQDVVNKSYLDEQIDAVETPDLSTYSTKTFAEDLSYRPASLRWLFKGTNGGSGAPANQSFKFDGDYVRLSFITLNNVDLGVGRVGDTGSITFTNGPVGIIWYRDGELKWKMKQQFRINSWRWNYNGHFEFRRSSRHGTGDSSFTIDAAYYITVGGFF